MTTYKELHGRSIAPVSSNPSTSGDAGKIFYNSTDNVFRSIVSTEAWSSAPLLITGLMGGITFGTQTAGNYVAGFSPSVSNSNANQEYNGTGWSSGTNFPSSQTGSGGGAGPQTAGLAAGGGGGSRTADAYEYDGTSWSPTGALPSAADNIGSCGTETQSNVIMAMGRIPSTGNAGNNTTAVYNGSTFSSGPNVGTGRMFGPGSAAGTGTAGLVFGGFIDPSPNAMTNTEEYDGSSWTAGGSLSNPSGLNCGWGTQTNAIAQCNPSTYKTFEGYDGTTWSSKPSTATGGNGYANAAGATGSAGWITSLGPAYKATEEFNQSTDVVTAAAWSSGGNLNLARHNGGNAGTKTAGLFFGGKVYPNVFKNESEEYDGTSWTEGNNLGTARMIAGAGTQTAGLGFGGTNGAPGSTGVQALTEEYDGSSWSENGDMSTARMDLGGAGLQTAAYAAGGIGSPNSVNDLHEQYNGSSWSTATAMNTERSTMGSVGTTTAGLVFGGYIPPSYAFATSSEEWNGSAWTSGGNLITARVALGGFGSQTDAIGFAGQTPPNNNSSVVEGYDGTAFSTRPSMAQARMQFSPSGSYNSGSDGMAVGGSNVGTPVYNNTEEWSAETQTVASKTLTTS